MNGQKAAGTTMRTASLRAYIADGPPCRDTVFEIVDQFEGRV